MRLDPSQITSLEQVVMQPGNMGVEVETLGQHTINGVHTKVFRAKKAGTFIGKHKHPYSHGHLVAAGGFRLFADGAMVGDYWPGDMMEIQAFVDHVIMSLVDDSVGACIHPVEEPIIVGTEELQ